MIKYNCQLGQDAKPKLTERKVIILNFENKIDRRKKYYLVFDCETATLPFASTLENANDKQKIAIAKPLIYDLGWQVIDRKGNVYCRRSFLVSEIFSVPAVFNTAYFASKRPIYLDKLTKGEIILTDWKTATAKLEEDLQKVEAVGAYNSMFDYKKAIPFTEKYIKALYSPYYYKWEQRQIKHCKQILSTPYDKKETDFNPEIFEFRGKEYALFDLWGLSCRHLLNNDEYKKTCIDNDWKTTSGKFFKTSAETAFRFLTKNNDFIESHTAIEDTIIESQILTEIIKRTRNKFEMGIIYFPFRELGTVEDFEFTHNNIFDLF